MPSLIFLYEIVLKRREIQQETLWCKKKRRTIKRTPEKAIALRKNARIPHYGVISPIKYCYEETFT